MLELIKQTFKDLKELSYTDELLLPSWMCLYRAAETLDSQPKPRICLDTGKKGVYFSLNSPYLAETMVSEYNKQLTIGVYQLTRPIKVYKGKYSYRSMNNANISHIDNKIIGMFSTILPKEDYAELFLNKHDCKHVQLIDSYKLSVKESRIKWGYYRWDLINSL